MPRVEAILLCLVAARALANLWYWATREPGSWAGPLSTERAIGHWMGAHFAAHRRKVERDKSPDLGYYYDLTSRPRCAQCGKEVRVRRGYCRSCGQGFGSEFHPLGCLVALIVILIILAIVTI